MTSRPRRKSQRGTRETRERERREGWSGERRGRMGRGGMPGGHPEGAEEGKGGGKGRRGGGRKRGGGRERGGERGVESPARPLAPRCSFRGRARTGPLGRPGGEIMLPAATPAAAARAPSPPRASAAAASRAAEAGRRSTSPLGPFLAAVRHPDQRLLACRNDAGGAVGQHGWNLQGMLCGAGKMELQQCCLSS